MATLQHKDITDPNIHEPKGVASAQAGQVYKADGAGSGVWEFSAGSAYGEIYITSGSASQTLPASSGTAKLNPTGGWEENGNANVTLSGTNGQITVLAAGEYTLNFWITFTTAAVANGGKYNFHYAINGVPSSRKVIVAKYSNGADTMHCQASGLAELSANDVVSMYVGGDATTSSSAITPLEAGFSVSLIQPS